MRISELHKLLTEHFGEQWVSSYVKDMVHSELGGQTVLQALELGFEPASIWKVISKKENIR